VDQLFTVLVLANLAGNLDGFCLSWNNNGQARIAFTANPPAVIGGNDMLVFAPRISPPFIISAVEWAACLPPKSLFMRRDKEGLPHHRAHTRRRDYFRNEGKWHRAAKRRAANLYLGRIESGIRACDFHGASPGILKEIHSRLANKRQRSA
jgi:hypothetical protein